MWRRRLVQAAMTVLPVAFLVGQLPGLGAMQRLAVVTQRVCLVVLIVTASLLGRRLRISKQSALFLGFVLWTIPFLATTTDWRTAVEQRLAWAVMVVAAIAVTRLCVDIETTWRVVVRPMRSGMVIAVVIVAAGAVIDPSSLHSGFGRFMPWGANPNVLASNLVAALPLFAYSAWNQEHRRRWLALTAVAVGLVVITGSRGGYLAVGLIAVPFLVHAFRRPALVLTAGACIVGSAVTFINVNPVAADRVAVGSVSNRANIASQYLDVVSARPWVGLLYSHGQSAQVAEGIETGVRQVATHAHNAYIQHAYWGGIALALPFVLIALAALRSAWKLWQRRSRYSHPMLVAVIAWTTIAVYVHGATGIMMIFPTYSWAWLGMICTLLVWRPQSLRTSVRASPPVGVASSP